MKISSKGRYGIRILLELALNNGELLTAREIAERQEISLKYTEQIVSILGKAGLIRSQRGSTGGYVLGVDPHEVLVGDILRATEGSLSVSDCLDTPDTCGRQDQCVARVVWQKMQTAIEDVIDHITLADLVADHQNNQNFVYII